MSGPASAPEIAAAEDPFALVAALDRLGERDIWPGFDPAVVPIAIFDGERTLLFRHATAPAGFEPVPERRGVLAWPGRHPSVTANSSVKLGGRRTATVMPGDAGDAVDDRLGVLVHEMFHVHQRERHPGWQANEVELFTYPIADAGLLILRRLESSALRRALAATSVDSAACWSASAMALRRERFASLSPGAIGWERGTELTEGLADYAAHRALATADTSLIPAAGFPADEPRRRAYASGAAIGTLLDRLDPAWRAVLERGDTAASDATPLDSLLAAAAASRVELRSAVPPCAFDPDAHARARRTAALDIAALRERLAAERRALLERPGWRVVFEAPETPFFPQRFDPLNVRVVAPGEVVHARYLQIGNDAGTIEVLGIGSLTEAAGAHPLFDGVRTLTVVGISVEPIVSDSAGLLVLRADGLQARLRGARITRGERALTVLLAPSATSP